MYTPELHVLSLRDRTTGAWLWSHRRAVVAGVAAAALRRAVVDADVPIELIAPNARPQPGLVVRNETLAADEISYVARLPVTTPARTAYDLGRYQLEAKPLHEWMRSCTQPRIRSRTCCCWPNAIRVGVGCDGCAVHCHTSTAAPHLPRRPGCGC